VSCHFIIQQSITRLKITVQYNMRWWQRMEACDVQRWWQRMQQRASKKRLSVHHRKWRPDKRWSLPVSRSTGNLRQPSICSSQSGGHELVPPNDEQSLMQAVANQPVAVSVYTSVIVVPTINHAVTVCWLWNRLCHQAELTIFDRPFCDHLMDEWENLKWSKFWFPDTPNNVNQFQKDGFLNGCPIT